VPASSAARLPVRRCRRTSASKSAASRRVLNVLARFRPCWRHRTRQMTSPLFRWIFSMLIAGPRYRTRHIAPSGAMAPLPSAQGHNGCVDASKPLMALPSHGPHPRKSTIEPLASPPPARGGRWHSELPSLTHQAPQPATQRCRPSVSRSGPSAGAGTARAAPPACRGHGRSVHGGSAT
jgi:hypothetical protein